MELCTFSYHTYLRNKYLTLCKAVFQLWHTAVNFFCWHSWNYTYVFLSKKVQRKNISFQISLHFALFYHVWNILEINSLFTLSEKWRRWYSMNSLWFFFSPLNLSLIGRLSLRTLKMPLLFWDSSSLANFSSRNVKVSEVYEESHRIAGNSVYSLLSL